MPGELYTLFQGLPTQLSHALGCQARQSMPTLPQQVCGALLRPWGTRLEKLGPPLLECLPIGQAGCLVPGQASFAP